MPSGRPSPGTCPSVRATPTGHAHSWAWPLDIGHYVRSWARTWCMLSFPGLPKPKPGSMSSPPGDGDQGTCPAVGPGSGHLEIMSSGGKEHGTCPALGRWHGLMSAGIRLPGRPLLPHVNTSGKVQSLPQMNSSGSRGGSIVGSRRVRRGQPVWQWRWLLAGR